MRTLMFSLSCWGLFFTHPAICQEVVGTNPAVTKKIKDTVALGQGVYAVETDKKGRISSCIIVGQARISTVLGKTKGLEMAREKAKLTCSAEFVRWLKEDVTVYVSSEDEAVILVEGSEGKGDDSLNESGKAVEKNGKKMESISKGCVRGLMVLHKEINGDGKTYTLVMGFKTSRLEGLKKLNEDLKVDEPKGKNGKDSTSGGSKDKKAEKNIENESATSDDAGDFFPARKK